MTEKQARKIRETLLAASAKMTDAEVSEAPDMLARMTYDGSLIKNGTRINWGGHIKRAAVDVWDREDQTPEAAPDLWEDVMYRDGIRIIPEHITVGLAFSTGELGWWGDKLYRSKTDNNVYTPAEYPDNWDYLDAVPES